MTRGESAQHCLEHLAALTDQVHTAINDGDWLRAAEIDVARRAAMEALFERLAAEPARGAQFDADLVALATRTRHEIGEVQHHRRRVTREASTVSIGRRASREYQSVSTDS
jgi:hypothetical protein